MPKPYDPRFQFAVVKVRDQDRSLRVESVRRFSQPEQTDDITLLVARRFA